MRKQVKKLWGTEYWLVNEPQYCAKLLEIEPGYACSYHMHPRKIESFLVSEGAVMLETGPMFPKQGPKQLRMLTPEDEPVQILSFHPHRFWSATDEQATILEISTFHDDDDVVRLEESRKIDI